MTADDPDALLALAPAWRGWVVTNLLEGLSASQLQAELVESGVPEALARAEVAAIAGSEELRQLRAWARPHRQATAIVELRRALSRRAPGPLPRGSTPAPEVFFRDFFAQQRPAIFTDLTARWPALERWTPELLRARFGEAPVEIVMGREGDPDFDQRHADHVAVLPFCTYVDRVLACSPSNDLYMVARNATLERAPFDQLWEDVHIPEGLFSPYTRGRGASLWFGPAGTLTPLHHDTCNILFNQIYGRKAFALIPPWELSVVQSLRGFYSTLDASDRGAAPEAWAGVEVHEVILEPGETLFLPAGWLHQVRALEVSISFSLLRFAGGNAYDDFRPGF